MLQCLLAMLVALTPQDKAVSATGTQEAKHGPRYARSHALVIGIDKYEHLPNENQLNYAVRDAVVLKDYLVDLYGFDEPAVSILKDGEASLASVRSALARFLDPTVVGPEDRVLIYFSGHGVTLQTPAGGQMGFLLPANAPVASTSKLDQAYLHGLSMKEAWEMAENCPAKHLVFIADACYSGLLAQARAPVNGGGVDVFLKRRARQILTAGGHNEKAVERMDLGHGVYTYTILDQLRDRALVGEPFTLSELHSVVQRRVVTLTNGQQVPQYGVAGASEGQMVFYPSAQAASKLASFNKLTESPKGAIGPLTLIEGSNTILLQLRKSDEVSPPTIVRKSPDLIEMVYPRVEVIGPKSFNAPTEDIKRITIEDRSGSVAVALHLRVPMTQLLTVKGSQVVLELARPTGRGAVSVQPDGTKTIPVGRRTVMVDAGHGGHDPGAKLRGSSLQEKDVTLAIALVVAERLRAQGYRALLTRDEDKFIPLAERAEKANKADADLMVSLHVNTSSAPNTRSGTMMFYHGVHKGGELFASFVGEVLGAESPLELIGTYSDRTIYESGFAILRNASMPAAMIELGYGNHNRDAKILSNADEQRKIATVLASAIHRYLEVLGPK